MEERSKEEGKEDDEMKYRKLIGVACAVAGGLYIFWQPATVRIQKILDTPITVGVVLCCGYFLYDWYVKTKSRFEALEAKTDRLLLDSRLRASSESLANSLK